MRLGVMKALCLLLVFLSICGFAFADDKAVNLQSVVVQSFDPFDKDVKNMNQEVREVPWFLMASKFATAVKEKGSDGKEKIVDSYPKSAIAKAWPLALWGSNKGNLEYSALGIAMMFDRKEYNWVDIVPGTVDKSGDKPKYKPVELPFPGRVSQLDLWVWGGGFNYYLELFIRDYKGAVYTIPMGDINHEGWKNIRVNIPENIVQSKKYLPKKEGLRLVKFRIWTKPTEIVAVMPDPTDGENAPMKPVYFYFDQIKVLTDVFESLFDGDSLTDPAFLKETWSGDSKSAGK